MLRTVTSTLGGVLALALATPPAAATEISSVRGRIGTLYDFDGIDTRSLAVTLEPDTWPAIFRREGDMHYEVGVLRLPRVDRGDDLYGVHFAPAWHFAPELLAPYAFVELGIGATWLSGRHIRARDLGSRVHFVAHALLGLRPGRTSPWHAGLRIRHTSNAGLASANPGFDLIQLEIGYRFGAD
jgi:hypothetical protein